ATTAGVTSEGGYDYESNYGGYDYGSYGGGYGSDYGGSYGNDYGSYGGSDESFGKNGRQGGSGGKGGGMGGGGGSTETNAETKQQKSSLPTTGSTATTRTKNPLIKELIKDIQTSAKEITKIIEDNKLFSNLEKHLQGKEDTDPVNTDLANNIVEINKKITALEQEIQSLQSMMLKQNASTKTYYNSVLSAALEKPLETIAGLRTTLEKISFKQIKNKQQKLTPEKEWAYFVGDDKLLTKIEETEAPGTEKTKDLRDKVTSRISLEELFESLKSFEATIKTFKDKMAKVSAQIPPAAPIVPMAPLEIPPLTGKNPTE
ncbi:MAG TPA: hypothetical protein VGO09_08795, partial [Flavisolibacter sp.]|nr:hypothetical protein [Flavisolibacter sp.]